MQLRTKLLLAVVAANFAAFAVLAVAIARDVERRGDLARAQSARIREEQVARVGDIFIKWFQAFDFDLGPSRVADARAAPARRIVKEILAQPFWTAARDAYLTDNPFRFNEQYQPGEFELNPIGAPDAESEQLRLRALDLVERAYRDGVEQRDGEILAIPLFGSAGPGRQREKVGAAYIRVDVPQVQPLSSGIEARMVAIALGGSTIIAIAGIFALLHVLVLRPLHDVSSGARRVRFGDYTRPVPRTGRADEIDTLVAAFNEMMLEVGQSREALERRVRDAVLRARESEKRLILTERLAAMGTLAAGIAHEINNPLGGMINALRVVEKPDTKPDVRQRYLKLIGDGLDRVRGVVARVLRFAPNRKPKESVSIAALVDDVARFLQFRLNEKAVTFDVAIEDGLRVDGDAAALGQVFLNLIANAIDALDAPPRRIELVGRRVAGRVRVEVADNGVGMSAEQAARAFDLFFTTKVTGSGLGLFIVHEIVSEHGGTIEVRSEPGAGARFVLEFPTP